MPTSNLSKFLQSEGKNLPSPIAVILAEDDAELAGTVRHHQNLGFTSILVIGAVESLDIDGVHTFPAQLNQGSDSVAMLNVVMAGCTGKWLYYCYNAEYLFFPFCETRSISDVLAFMEEERRTSVFSYAIDLYPSDLSSHSNGIDIDGAHLDQSGYYGTEQFIEGEVQERQPEIFGGLRWRFEKHIPWEKRRIDRICMFKVSYGLTIGDDFRLSEPELNTISCEWHNNLTMGVLSFRVTKALMHNPGSAEAIDSFYWSGSVKFNWRSDQLMELGFIEPGQWF